MVYAGLPSTAFGAGPPGVVPSRTPNPHTTGIWRGPPLTSGRGLRFCKPTTNTPPSWCVARAGSPSWRRGVIRLPRRCCAICKPTRPSKGNSALRRSPHPRCRLLPPHRNGVAAAGSIPSLSAKEAITIQSAFGYKSNSYYVPAAAVCRQTRVVGSHTQRHAEHIRLIKHPWRLGRASAPFLDHQNRV